MVAVNSTDLPFIKGGVRLGDDRDATGWKLVLKLEPAEHAGSGSVYLRTLMLSNDMPPLHPPKAMAPESNERRGSG